jgi:hypothetical protein
LQDRAPGLAGRQLGHEPTSSLARTGLILQQRQHDPLQRWQAVFTELRSDPSPDLGGLLVVPGANERSAQV